MHHPAQRHLQAGWTLPLPRPESIETIEPGWAPAVVGTGDTYGKMLRTTIFAPGQRYHQFSRLSLVAGSASRYQCFVVLCLLTGHLQVPSSHPFAPEANSNGIAPSQQRFRSRALSTPQTRKGRGSRSCLLEPEIAGRPM